MQRRHVQHTDPFDWEIERNETSSEEWCAQANDQPVDKLQRPDLMPAGELPHLKMSATCCAEKVNAGGGGGCCRINNGGALGLDCTGGCLLYTSPSPRD